MAEQPELAEIFGDCPATPSKSPAGSPPQEKLGQKLLEYHRSAAEATLRERLHRVADRHPGYSIHLVHFGAASDSASITVTIDHPGIWERVAPTARHLKTRIEQTLGERLGCRATVRLARGSLEISVLLSAIDVASLLHEIVSTISATVDYVAKCIEDEQLHWPPMAMVIGFFGLVRRLLPI